VFSVRKGANPLGLALMRPNGDERRGVTDDNDFAPAFSPDGEKLAFVRAQSDGVFLYISGARGQAARPLLQLRPRDSASCGASFAWSPDSLQLAVALREEAASPDCDLAVVDLAGSVRSLDLGEEDVSHPSWSPDGNVIAYARGVVDEDHDIYSVPAEGGDPVRLTDDPSEDIDPAWSPDGAWIAFNTDRDDTGGTEFGASNFEIYLMDPAGEQETRITVNDINDHGPVWSPYGEWIAYSTSALCDGPDCGQYADIWKVRSDGTDATRLTTTRRDSEFGPAWSPSGHWIAYVRRWRPGRFDLAKVHASGRRMVRLTRTAGIEEFEPSWR
jgi:Tol biopolymer transport system component